MSLQTYTTFYSFLKIYAILEQISVSFQTWPSVSVALASQVGAPLLLPARRLGWPAGRERLWDWITRRSCAEHLAGTGTLISEKNTFIVKFWQISISHKNLSIRGFHVTIRVETVQSSPQFPKPLTGTGTAVPPELWALSLLQSSILFSPYVFLSLLSFYLISFSCDGCYASCFLMAWHLKQSYIMFWRGK